MARPGTSALTMHELLLALAGRVDDDLLALCRELVAIGEDAQALELLTATLIADRTVLPPQVRASVAAFGQSLRIGLDAERELPAGRRENGTTHRFDPDAGGRGATTRIGSVLAGAAHRPPGCRTWLTWRITPAGSAPGPLPHPVVLVEIAAEVAFEEHLADVLAYRLAAVLDRAGAAASVEVFVAGTVLPSYHAAALSSARPVPDAAPHRPAHLRARSGPPQPRPLPAPDRVSSIDTSTPRPAPERHPAPRFAADPVALDGPTTGLRIGAAGPPTVQLQPPTVPTVPAVPTGPTTGAPSATEASGENDAPASTPPVDTEVGEEAGAGPLGELPDPLTGPLRQPLLDPLLDPTSAPEPQVGAETPVPAEPEPPMPTEPPRPWADEWASGEWALPVPPVAAGAEPTANGIAEDDHAEDVAAADGQTGHGSGEGDRLTDTPPVEDRAEPTTADPGRADSDQPDPDRTDRSQPVNGPAAPRPVRRRGPHLAPGGPFEPPDGRRRARHRSEPDPEEAQDAAAPSADGPGEAPESAADPTVTLSEAERSLLHQLRAELNARERSPRRHDSTNGFTPPPSIGPPEIDN
ncbi:hypothetical protein ACFQE5_17285 [Pseudonocardia hispaniensis]|uniref:Basic proline-rich protein n=1 Tax=Pseudonocardia hispaniensis TaxID=904933 RepID=A0ABW1J6A5_9PSEU